MIFKFSYDSENDDLFLYNPKAKSEGGIELGNLVIDYNEKKQIVGIQMLSATNLIKKNAEDKTDLIKAVLKKLKKCDIKIKEYDKTVQIKVELISSIKTINAVISIPQLLENTNELIYA